MAASSASYFSSHGAASRVAGHTAAHNMASRSSNNGSVTTIGANNNTASATTTTSNTGSSFFSKSPGRSRFSKALPAPPAALEKLFTPSSSSLSSSSPAATQASLPSLPLPPPPSSSLFNSTSSYTFVPTVQEGPHPPPKPVAMPGTISSSPAVSSFTSTYSSYHTTPPASAASPSLPPLPQQPPQTPAKNTAAPQPPPLAIRTAASASAAPSRPIRRRPVGSAISVASSGGSSTRESAGASSTPLPALPSSASGALEASSPTSAATSLPLPQLPNLPTLPSLSSLPSFLDSLELSKSTGQAQTQSQTHAQTQAQTQTLSPPSRQSSPATASISSILSAYSPSVPGERPLSPRDAVPADPRSDVSYMAAAEPKPLSLPRSPRPPLQPLRSSTPPSTAGSVTPRPSDQRTPTANPAASGGYSQPSDYSYAGTDQDTPLLYLLEEDYGQEGEFVGDNSDRQASDDIFDHYHEIQDDSCSQDKETVAEPQPSVRPPRTTSLQRPPSDATTVSSVYVRDRKDSLQPKTELKPTTSSSLPIAPPELQSASASATTTAQPPQIWKRRSEKAEGGSGTRAPSELKLTPSRGGLDPAQPPQQQQQPEQVPQKGTAPVFNETYPGYQPPLPPPSSPLPRPPPSRGGQDQLSLPRSPAGGSNPSPVVSASSPLAGPSQQLRVGLPSRDIRPSRIQSPALIPSRPSAATSGLPDSLAVTSPTPTTAFTPSSTSAASAGTTSTLSSLSTASTTSTLYSSASPAAGRSEMGESLSKLEAKATKLSTPLRTEDGVPPPPPSKDAEVQPMSTIRTMTYTASVAPAGNVPASVTESMANTAKPLPPFRRLPTPDYDDDETSNKLMGGGPKPGMGVSGSAAASRMKPLLSSANSAPPMAVIAHAPAAPASPEASPEASPTPSLDQVPSLPQQPQTPRTPLRTGGLVGRDSRPVTAQAQMNTPTSMNGRRPGDQHSPPPPPPQQPQQQFSARTSSRKASLSAGSVPFAASSRDAEARNDEGSATGEGDSVVTVKPGGHASDEEEAKLAPGMPPLFPTGYMTPVEPDTVFEAPAPGHVHFTCMTRHRDMFRDRNANYPLSCQTCQTFERSVRWRCKWCYLRICTECRDALIGPAIERDLGRLMETLATTTDRREHKAHAYDGLGMAVPYPSGLGDSAELAVIQEA